MNNMDFGRAVQALQAGSKVARIGWNGKGMWLTYIAGWESDRVYNYEKLPFIAMKTADNKLVPWLASQTDVLAYDWMTVE